MLSMQLDPDPVPVPRDPTPGELVARAGAGDVDAFTALVIALHPVVHRWALVFADDPDEADDIVQETFVQMHRHLGQFQGEAPLEGWLYRIVRRAAGQRRRSALRRLRLAASSRARPERDAYLTDPGARVDREWAAARIRDFFRGLPARQREIFDLVDLQGYDPADVARMTGMNPATVRVHLFRARAAVRAHLIARHPGATEIAE